MVTAVLAVSIGAPIAGFVGEINVPQPMRTAQIAGQSELSSVERADGWLNSLPLTATALRGKVVLIDFWTYTCSCPGPLVASMSTTRAWAR